MMEGNFSQNCISNCLESNVRHLTKTMDLSKEKRRVGSSLQNVGHVHIMLRCD